MLETTHQSTSHYSPETRGSHLSGTKRIYPPRISGQQLYIYEQWEHHPETGAHKLLKILAQWRQLDENTRNLYNRRGGYTSQQCSQVVVPGSGTTVGMGAPPAS